MHENPIVKHPAQAVLKAKSYFCECSDIVFSSVVFVAFKQLPYRERKVQRKQQRKPERQRGYSQESLLTYRGTHDKVLWQNHSPWESKPGFLHTRMRTLPQCFLICGEDSLCLVTSHLALQSCCAVVSFSLFFSLLFSFLYYSGGFHYQSAGMKW